MELLIGAVWALSVGIMARIVGLDRDRAFYPTVMMVIALNYALFASLDGSGHVLAVESIFIVMFLAASIAGFRKSLWLAVIALAAHGVFDFFHDRLITNTGVPAWWPPFCLAYDVVAAAYLAWLLSRSKISAVPARQLASAAGG